MKIQMYSISIGILAASLAVAGCNGSSTPANGNALATPSSAAPAADGSSGAVATGGRADAARPAEAPGSAAATPAPAAAPVWREVTIPAGTSLPVVLDTGVSSETSRAEQPVTAHLSRAITVDGMTALPEGSRVSGVVTSATRSGKVKGNAHIAMRFDSVTPRGDEQRYEIRTTSVGRTAASTKKEDAVKIGAPAAGGAIIGAIAGGKKGAAIGTAIGGGAGTGVVLATRGKEVSLAKGAALTLKLSEPLTVRVRS
jgi:hypothetical protein